MSENQPPVTETKNDDGSTTLSMKLSEMSLDQLVQVNQALGRRRDKIRDDMLHIRGLIDAKVKGKLAEDINSQIRKLEALRDGTPNVEDAQNAADIVRMLEGTRDGKPLPDEPGVVHATAPGAVIEVKASKN